MKAFTSSIRRTLAIILALLMVLTLVPAAMAQEPAPTRQLQQAPHETNQWAHLGGASYRIYGYREGLVGYTTANGHVIQPNDFFVALPCFCNLSKKDGYEYQVRLEYNGKSIVVPVWDVGPWNVSDNYWDPPEKRKWPNLPQGMPMANAAYYDNYNGGLDGWDRRITSPGGIDIGDGAFYALGMKGSDWLKVTFLWLEDDDARQPEPPTVAPQPTPEPPPAAPAPEPPAPAPQVIHPTVYDGLTKVYAGERPPLESAPVVEDGNYGYIWETGHNVPLPMVLHFWETGGLTRYGFPISEPFWEVAEDGHQRLIQYFERAVLELRYDEAGQPSVHQDGIGYRTRLHPDAAVPVTAFESSDQALYFAETGHSLRFGFKAYWEQNGGAEVFGNPLSEEWAEVTDEGRTVVLQVFERARLEWWPDKVGTADEITRGLLGREELVQRGFY